MPKLQAPKGTRDFYPKDMAWRNHIVDAWRRVSIRNGFDQVDGPIFESLDLYKVKSGEGIVSELFHFTDRGERELAIRPEFTPTLARMVAEQANALPKPIKWFCTPNLCRAEKPQRGRLREFWQWNVDILGSDLPVADAECIFTAVDLLKELGLGPQHLRVKISHRQTVRHILKKLGVVEEKHTAAFELLDRRDKIEPAEFTNGAKALGLDEERVARFDQICRMEFNSGSLGVLYDSLGIDPKDASVADIQQLDDQLRAFGIAEWCVFDLGIVRGLAYYTGTVFEIHETSGAMRALAGGGRYDQLIELFGGPKTPAVGFGMGDVVLSDVLRDKGLVPEDTTPRPDVFVIASSDRGAGAVASNVAKLRLDGFHARFSYKTTRNVGKLLKDASDARARFVLILGDAVGDAAGEGQGQLKDLAGGTQIDIALGDVSSKLRV
ncbi:MAG: histidine--tRNA ligase [Planctomycetota bacterium]|nr:histidine--tRNA ligase [Planctomycetota bacterium]